MKIPKTFECGGSTVTVEIVKNLRGREGEWISSKSLIRLQDSSEQNMMATFIHELLHAIRDRYGHEVPDDHQDESSVEGMAQGLTQFFKTAK